MVSPVNDTPLTQGASYSGSIGQTIAFKLSASDVDGDMLSYERMSFSGDGSTGGGQLSGTAPDLRFTSYTPGTYTLTFRVRDAAGAFSNTSTLTFAIASVDGFSASGDVNSAEPNAAYIASVIVPLPDVRLHLEQDGRVVANTQTNSKGHYTFYGVNPGNYLVIVDSVTTDGDGVPVRLPFVLSLKLKVKLNKKTPEQAQFAVPVFSLYSIWGQVMNAANAQILFAFLAVTLRLRRFTQSSFTITTPVTLFAVAGQTSFIHSLTATMVTIHS